MAPLGLRLRKSEKVLASFAAVTAAVWAIEPIHEILYPVRIVSFAVSLVLGIVVVTSRLAAVGRWVVRRTLRRVRYRMVAVFFFVGALPITFSVLLLLLGVSFLFGPLTADMLTTELRQVRERVDAVAGPLAWQLRDVPTDERRSLLEEFHGRAEPDYPGLTIQAELEGMRTSLPSGWLRSEIPPDLGLAPGVVRYGNEMLLAAILETPQPAVRLLLAVPLSSDLIRTTMPGLDILELRPDGSAGAEGGTRRVPIVPLVQAERPTGQESSGPSWHPSSWRIVWPLRSPILTLNTGEFKTDTCMLVTRPYDLWSKIFGTLPEDSFGLFAFLANGLLAAFGASVLASVIVATSLTRTLTKAVHDLDVGTKHVNEGDFSYRIPVSGYDQVSDLSRSFNSMTESLEGLIEESKQRQQLEAELEIAREVQAKLFPATAPRIAGLEVLGACRPARAVSGDFFDYMGLGGQRLAISFGDVSGKGISAALLMASLHSIMRAQCAQLRWGDALALQESAVGLVRQANEQLQASTESNKFATLFFGAFDAASGTLVYVNAGHLPPLVLRNGSARPLDVTGPIVGAFPSVEFGASTLEIESGDLVVAYTDGLTEPEDEAGEAFGEECLQEAVTKRRDNPLRSLIEEVMDEVIAWTGRPTLQDDMTMLVVRKG